MNYNSQYIFKNPPCQISADATALKHTHTQAHSGTLLSVGAEGPKGIFEDHLHLRVQRQWQHPKQTRNRQKRNSSSSSVNLSGPGLGNWLCRWPTHLSHIVHCHLSSLPFTSISVTTLLPGFLTLPPTFPTRWHLKLLNFPPITNELASFHGVLFCSILIINSLSYCFWAKFNF